MNVFYNKQQGATLLLSLVLLLLLTVFALSSVRTATLQQRASSNLQQQNLAFQVAENGIAAAILRLRNNATDWSNINDKKWLCGKMGELPNWSNTACLLSGDYAYKVMVERVACDNKSDNICFAINSMGIYLDSTVFHQQGYVLLREDISSERYVTNKYLN